MGVGGCYDYYSLEAFETARQQTACTVRSQPANPKNTVISRDLHILVAVVNTFRFMDVLIIGDPRLKEKIVDGKGNIQSGKKVHHSTNC